MRLRAGRELALTPVGRGAPSGGGGGAVVILVFDRRLLNRRDRCPYVLADPLVGRRRRWLSKASQRDAGWLQAHYHGGAHSRKYSANFGGDDIPAWACPDDDFLNESTKPAFNNALVTPRGLWRPGLSFSARQCRLQSGLRLPGGSQSRRLAVVLHAGLHGWFYADIPPQLLTKTRRCNQPTRSQAGTTRVLRIPIERRECGSCQTPMKILAKGCPIRRAYPSSQRENGLSMTSTANWPTLPQTTTVLEPLGPNGDSQATSARIWSRWGAATGGAHDIHGGAQSYRAAILVDPQSSRSASRAGWHTVVFSRRLVLRRPVPLHWHSQGHPTPRALRVVMTIAYDFPALPAAANDALPTPCSYRSHREGLMFSTLVQRLEAMDYPRDRLEILLLIEAADDETLAAIAGLAPRPAERCMRVVIVPRASRKTKPRALNVGLNRQGQIHRRLRRRRLIPTPTNAQSRRRLRRAAQRSHLPPGAAQLLQCPPELAHAPLRHRLHPLVRPRAAGLLRSSAFIPLGAPATTSAHPAAPHGRVGPVERHRRRRSWRPHRARRPPRAHARLNHLGRGRARSPPLDSSAQPLDQRVHADPPRPHAPPPPVAPRAGARRRARPAIAPRRHRVCAAGKPVDVAPHPRLHLRGHAGWRGVPAAEFIRSIYPAPIFYVAFICQLAGNFFFLYTIIVSCLAYGWDDLVPWALLAPFYWLLMTVAAWRAVISLIWSPAPLGQDRARR